MSLPTLSVPLSKTERWRPNRYYTLLQSGLIAGFSTGVGERPRRPLRSLEIPTRAMIGGGGAALDEQARFWVEELGLTAHPEGGYYRETYRSADRLPAGTPSGRDGGDRALLERLTPGA